MRMKILFGDEPGGWTVDGLDRSGGKFPMEGDRQDMCRAPFDLAAIQAAGSSVPRD